MQMTNTNELLPNAVPHRGYYQVRPSDVLAAHSPLLIDVRFKFRQGASHIHGVLHAPFDYLNPNTFDLSLIPKGTIVLVCEDGRTSVRVAERLVEAGHPLVHHLVGGMLRWEAEGRPSAIGKSWTLLTKEPG